MTNKKNKQYSPGTQQKPNPDSVNPDAALADSSRRNLLKGAGLFGAAVSVGASPQIIAQQSPATAQSVDPVAREALEVLTAAEAEVLEAVCETLIPSDENGPGAKEARAAHYIDRSLGSHNKDYRTDYLISLAAIDEFAKTTHSDAFSNLNSAARNDIVQALQNGDIPDCSPGSSAFFSLVRSHTIDGTFCDPYYGGNRDFVGWDMLRYPGVRLGVSEAEVASGSQLSPNHESAYDNATYTKRPNREGEL